MNCLFCSIAQGHIPAEKVYEDEHAVGFLDIYPRTPGHTIIVPRHHSATLESLPEAEVAPLFLAVQKMARTLVSALGAEGLTIGINQGEVSGQTVPHLHVHLMPRFKGDGGGSVQSAVHTPQEETLPEIARRIKNLEPRT